MKAIPTAIPGVTILEPTLHGDARGYFTVSWAEGPFREATGFAGHFVQENESLSRRGVLRGLHYQAGEAAQGKLVRVVRGRVLDVALDLRRGSPTFGRHAAVELDDVGHRQLWIPRGLAHGFVTLSEEALFLYLCDGAYCPPAERGIAWDDPALGIDWRLPSAQLILSERDRHHPRLAQATDLFDYGA